MNIGAKIIEIRKQRNMTQEDFAKIFHVTRQTVSNWENEKSYPNLQTLVQISNEFDVSLDTMLKEDMLMVKRIDHFKIYKKAFIGLITCILTVGVFAGIYIGVCKIQHNRMYDKVENTPHGVACAMMLPIVMEYNADCTGEKYREIARAMGVKGVDEMSVEEYRKAAIDAVQQLSVDVGIPTKLESLKEEDLDFLAESAHADACAPGNPKDASVEDLKDLFRRLM